MDRIVGIELGADYYMRSPVNPRELVARVKQIFRKRERDGDGESGRIFVGDLEIDPDQVQVLKEGKEILLSPREFKLLHTLAQSPGRVFPRTALLRQVWGEEEYIDERTVNVYVQRLRNKLGDNPNDPKLIETVRGFGYRLVRRRRSSGSGYRLQVVDGRFHDRCPQLRGTVPRKTPSEQTVSSNLAPSRPGSAD